MKAVLSLSLSLLVAAGLLGVAAPAFATSCAMDPSAIPEAILAGKPMQFSGRPLFHDYDLAVVGTVVAINTVDDDRSPIYGRTWTTFAVDAMFGTSSAPAQLTLTSSDPGWMNGYGFQLGQSYFVPFQAVGPDGTANYSFLCDPITPVHNPPLGEWIGLAEEAGISVALPEPGEEPPVSDGLPVGPAVAVASAVAALAGAALMRKRRLAGA